jgi:hypothetical protein
VFDRVEKNPLISITREWRNWQTCLLAGRRAKFYAIKSAMKNYIYVGLTADTNRRIAEHDNKKEQHVPMHRLRLS